MKNKLKRIGASIKNTWRAFWKIAFIEIGSDSVIHKPKQDIFAGDDFGAHNSSEINQCDPFQVGSAAYYANEDHHIYHGNMD